MTANDELVVKLFALATYAEKANHRKDDKRLMDAAGVADAIHEGIDRIEELEAKLAVAMEAADYLLRAVDDLMDGPAYHITDVHLMVEEGAKIQSVADARATLAELKGGKDE